jgi:molecular chaperone GrpE
MTSHNPIDETSQTKNEEIINSEENQTNPETNSEIQINSLKAEIEDWKNKSLRLAADLQNSQRQQQLDLENNSKITKKRVINSISQFLNTLFISFSFIPTDLNESGQKFVSTLKLSFDSLIKDLANLNIEVLVPVENEAFNPIYMNALNLETGSNLVVDKIVSVGFKIDGQITTPATVITKNLEKIDNN